MTSSNFYVYVHSRLNTGAPFYVGKGHARRAYTIKSRSQHWKNIVAKDGGWHVNFIAERVDEELAFLAEMEAIDKYRRLGVRLINLTDGGDGVSGYRPTKPPHNKGKPMSEKMKAHLSATAKARGILPPIEWNRGGKTPQEVIEKRRPAMLAAWAKAKADGDRKTSVETRAKQRAAKLGKKYSAEHCKNMSIAMKENKYVRVHPDMTGFKHTAESRAKMSASMKGRKSHQRKAVKCVDTGELFESATAAAKRYGRKEHTLIAACCKGSVKTAYGHKFEYINV